MIPRRPLSFRRLLGATLSLGLLSLAFLPHPSAAREPSREQQIAEIEKQITELSKKLEALRKQPTTTPTPTKVEQALPQDWVKSLHWRCIGPASMGGRITAFSVYEADPTTYWVATASGGLLKTSNNGVTFEHQFDKEATVSVGDVCVAPSDRNVVWVGTGEANPRNSVSYGDGVYKSTDGGKTWKNVGLKKSFQIGRIVVHPKNPDIVYVGALGRLYGPGGERGLYKTGDGGKTWDRVLNVDDRTGVIDVRMNPSDPETLLVATWERRRDEFDTHAGAIASMFAPGGKVEMPMPDGYDAYDPIKKWGPGGGIWKTTDGGKNWKKLSKGLPTCSTGRIGLDYYRKDPNVVFAIVDSEKIGKGTPPVYLGIQAPRSVPGGVRISAVTPNSPAAKAGLKVGDVLTAVDKKPVKTFDDLDEIIPGRKAGTKLVLSVLRDKKPQEITATLAERPLVTPGGRERSALDFLGEDTPGGVRVTRLFPRGTSGPAGLQAGDVIQLVDKTKVTSLRQLNDLFRKVKPGTKLAVRVLRGKETKDLALTPSARRPTPPNRPYAYMYGGQQPNAQRMQGPESHEYGGIYKSTDGGETWTRINSLNQRPMYFSVVRVDPTDEKYVYALGIQMHVSRDGGKSFRPGGDRGVHPDQHALWIDPRDGRHMLIGTDGGFYSTYDRAEHWDFLNTTAIGQFYHVAVDNRKPYRVYGGLQDNGSWGGASHTLDGQGPLNTDWFMVNGGDGFVCQVDSADPDIVYFESQDGNIGRWNLRTGERGFLRPRNKPGQAPYRFNWNTPFILSHHNPRIFYSGGNYVFRSLKRGDDPRPISPQITRTGKGSASALAESPRNPDVLWAGTDDGNLWVTRDGGVKWTNVAENVKLPGPRWVASIEASRAADGRAYVVFDAHRSDDDNPYVYVTEDFGQTWKSLRGNLPWGSTRVLREDRANPEVLYLGTEFAAWASVDRGASWTKINNNLPTVAVHEFAQPTTANEIVAATHGRSVWVLDVTPLRQMKAATAKSAVTLFQPSAAVHWRTEPRRGTVYGTGSRGFVGTNPLPGAQIYYGLGKKADKVRLEVQDYSGKTVARLQAPPTPGLHRVSWNLRGAPAEGGPFSILLPSGFVRGMARAGALAPPGQYRVVLSVDGKQYAQGLRVESDPTQNGTILTEPEGRARKRAGAWVDR